MKTWLVLFNKECKESLRNYKWIWIPLVFIILGMLQPITYYFLPDILKSVGGLSDGVVIQFPTPTGGQVLAETLGQYSQIGLLVLVLAYMGTVASERNNGTNVMVLVKPVSYISYLTAKWVHMCLITTSSLFLGMCFSYYYTYLLIESVPLQRFFLGSLVYLIFLVFVITLVLCFSSILKSTAAVAFLTIGLTAVMGIVNSLIPKLMRWSPNSLVAHSYLIFQNGRVGDYFWLALIGSFLLIVALLVLAIFVFKNKEKAIQTS